MEVRRSVFKEKVGGRRSHFLNKLNFSGGQTESDIQNIRNVKRSGGQRIRKIWSSGGHRLSKNLEVKVIK